MTMGHDDSEERQSVDPSSSPRKDCSRRIGLRRNARSTDSYPASVRALLSKKVVAIYQTSAGWLGDINLLSFLANDANKQLNQA